MIDDPTMVDLIRRVKRIEQEVDGLVKPEVGRWVDWTPTVDQGGAVSVTVDFARVFYENGKITLHAHLTVTGSGVAGNRIEVQSLPYAITQTSGRIAMGSCVILNSGTAVYAGTTDNAGSDIIIFMPGGSSSATGIGVSPSFALANPDTISFIATYE